MALEITDASFNEVISKKDTLVMIDFWATWCGPCQKIGPVIEELAQEYEGKAIIGKCDVDGNSDVVAQFRVRNVPTVVFLKNGELLDKLVGANPKSAFVEKIEKYL